MTTTSYNGWPASPLRSAINVADFTAAGAAFPSGVKAGDVTVVMRYLVEQLHARVEKVHPGWCWGFNYRLNRNANNLSCHASGTAIDYNAPAHPNGKAGTFSARQVREIRKILAELGGVVRWGGDFSRTKDEMHFEIAATLLQVKLVADRLRGVKPAPARAVVRTVRAVTVRRPKAYPSDGVVSLANLRRGKHNPDVRELQHVLNRWYPTLDLREDGDFGPATQHAVNRARRGFGMSTVGPINRRLLRKLGFRKVTA